MKRISLVAVDLDGTLLTSERTLAPDGAKLVRNAAAKGVRIVLATTRNPYSAQPFCRSMEINDPIICSNGAQVWASPDGPVWAYRSMSQGVGRAIAQWANAHDWELSTTVGSMTYWRQRPGQALGAISPNITIVASNSDGITGEPVRILASQPDAIEGIREFCRSELAGRCHTETYHSPDGLPHSLGIYAPEADKGTALALVLDQLGIAQQRVMAIGDDVNDLAMFRYAGVTVAMANAPDQVKRKAAVVAPSNDEEGVAWALKTFVLDRL